MLPILHGLDGPESGLALLDASAIAIAATAVSWCKNGVVFVLPFIVNSGKMTRRFYSPTTSFHYS